MTTLDRLDDHRLALIARLDALPPEAVHAKPASGGWSLAQIVDHLYRIDRGLVLDGTRAPGWVRRTSGLRQGGVSAILSLPLRIPAPPGAAYVLPADAPDYAATRDAWADLRGLWRQRLPELSPEAIGFQHPLAGPFVMGDALAFLLSHHRHHDAQVARTTHEVTHIASF